MLLFFRFVFVMLKALFRRRIGVLDESVVRFTVLPHDCDLNFHLNAGRYLSFMDAARGDLIGRLRLLRPLLKRGWRPVMGGCVMRFRRSVLPFQRFTVRSRVLGWDEKWFYVEHVVEKDGVFCATGHVRTLIRSKSANIPPSEVWALIGAGETPSPELPPFVARWREIEDAR
jgi:acyl-CoA thioesterase FadM